MNNSTTDPVALAQAQFIWTPPEGGEPGNFTVALYSTGGVELSAPGAYNGVVMGLEWSDKHQAIVSGGGFWSPKFSSSKEHLLLKATNALRHVLGLPQHAATSQYPGSEVT